MNHTDPYTISADETPIPPTLNQLVTQYWQQRYSGSASTGISNLCKESGISPLQLSNLLDGDEATAQEVMQLAFALGVDPEELSDSMPMVPGERELLLPTLQLNQPLLRNPVNAVLLSNTRFTQNQLHRATVMFNDLYVAQLSRRDAVNFLTILNHIDDVKNAVQQG